MKRARAGLAIVVPMVLGLAVPALPAFAAVSPRVEVIEVDDQSPGELKPGTSSNIEIFLWNEGDEVATGVSAVLSSTTEGVDVTGPGPQPYGDIEVKNYVTPVGNAEPFIVTAVGGAPCGPARFTLDVSTDQGAFALPVDIIVGGECVEQPYPQISYQTILMRDAETGATLDDLSIGEAITLDLGLRNVGSLDSGLVSARLSAPHDDADITEESADYGPIPIETEVIRPFALTLNACDPEGLVLHVAVDGAPVVNTGSVDPTPLPADTMEIVIETRCPGMHLLAKGATYEDTEGGNGDGIPQPGETVEIFVRIENDGADVLTGMLGTFTAEHADVLEGTAPFPDVAPADEVTNSTPFVIHIHEDAPSFTVPESDHCSHYTWGENVPIPPGTEIATFKQNLHIEGPAGQTEEFIGASVGVCAMPAVPTKSVSNGDVLPETGSDVTRAATIGGLLLGLGIALRIRARVPRSPRSP